MAVMSDKKSNGVQFSKLAVVIFCPLGLIGILLAAVLTIVFGLPEAIGCAMIGAFGVLSSTSVAFYFKKSQSENTVRMYVEAYKEIAEIKGDNEILDDLGENMLGKMTSTLDNSLEEATSALEVTENV